MTDLHPIPLPEISATVAYLGGNISRLSASRFVAVSSINGKRYFSSRATKHATVAFRQVQNKLRKVAGLPPLTPLCPTCGLNERTPSSQYCSIACHNAAGTGKARRLDTPERSAAEVLKRAQEAARMAELAHYDVIEAQGRNTRGLDVQTNGGVLAASETPEMPNTSNSRFRDALAKCDALILARGGSVPNGYHFADWQQRAAKRRRRERMLHG